MEGFVHFIQDVNTYTSGATSVVDSIQQWVWENFLFVALIAAGLFLTIRTRAVQWRSLPEMLRVLTDPSGHEADGRKSISSFGIPCGYRQYCGRGDRYCDGRSRCGVLDVAYCGGGRRIRFR